MADFTAVIQRAVDGLSDKSPEMRSKVYEKAKTAVQRQLNAMNPAPSEEMVARQMAKLDVAIAEIEAQFATVQEEPEPAETNTADESGTPEPEAEAPTDTPAEEPVAETDQPVEPAEAEEPETVSEAPPEEDSPPEILPAMPSAEQLEAPEQEPLFAEPKQEETAPTVEDSEHAFNHEESPFDADVEHEIPVTEPEAPEADSTDEPANGAEEVLYPFETSNDSYLEAPDWELPSIDDASGGESAELYDEPSLAQPIEPEIEHPAHYEQEEFSATASVPERMMEQAEHQSDVDRIVASLNGAADEEQNSSKGLVYALVAILAFVVVAGLAYEGWQYRDKLVALLSPTSSDVTTPGTNDNSPTTDANGSEKQTAGGEDTTEPAAKGIEKFTQRLLPDGTEVEEAAGPAATADPEGKSVAQLDEGAETAETKPDNASTLPPTAEKMFLYEERLGQASPTALEGSVVWSRQMESQDIGNPQPVIQAAIQVPERSLSATLTIKRNLDPTLPASHIIELVFSLPENFEGGGIDSVVRISMKQNEQDQGRPLIGVPARITDHFHMIALNALPEAEKTNLQLMAELDWIDIPLVYGNGRRSLLALEKGPDGKAVFGQVLSEWEKAASGQ